MSDAAAGSQTSTTNSDPAAAAAAAAAASSATSATDAAAASAAAAGGAAAAYYESFADKTVAGSPAIQRYKTVEDLAKGYVNLEKRFGVDPARRIDLPEDLADAKAMRDVYSKLGLPEKADGYTTKLPDGASDADKAVYAAFTAKAHEAGMPDSFVAASLNFWADQNAKALEAGKVAWDSRVADGKTELTQAWGAAEAVNRKAVDTLLERYGDVENKKALMGEGMNAYPGMALMLAKMAQRMSEPEGAGGQSGDAAANAERVLTPNQAAAAIATLEADPIKGKALHDKDHAMHKVVIAERRKLLRMKDGLPPE